MSRFLLCWIKNKKPGGLYRENSTTCISPMHALLKQHKKRSNCQNELFESPAAAVRHLLNVIIEIKQNEANSWVGGARRRQILTAQPL